MMHPDTEVRIVSEQMGYGVFARRFIPRGTVVYARDPLDLLLPPGHPLIDDPVMADTIEKYTYIEPDGTRVLCWDHGKYVNHCCHPSTLTTGYGFEIALRDLHAGDEVTDDYGIFNTPVPFPLVCENTNCRGMLTGDDYAQCHSSWDRRIREALDCFDRVEQPLLPLLPDNLVADVRAYLSTGKGYRSVNTQRHVQPTIRKTSFADSAVA